MTTQKQKITNLYLLIDQDNVTELSNYIGTFANPYIIKYGLQIGIGSYILSYALKVGSLECAKFAIELLDHNQMKNYIEDICKKLKYNPDIFYCYFNKLKFLTEQTGDTCTIIQLLFHLIQEKQIIPQEIVQEIIEMPVCDFGNKLKNNIDNFAINLETLMPKLKNSWITFFFQYYVNKNIDFRRLALHLILFYETVRDISKFWKLIKKYWNVKDLSKFKIQYIYRNIYTGEQKIMETEHEYTLEFIILITGLYEKLDNFTMFKNNTFETQLLNYISENAYFHNRAVSLFTSAGKINCVVDEEYVCPLFPNESIQNLKSIVKYLTNNIFIKLKELNQKYIDYYKLSKNKPNITYGELPNYFKEIDELHKEFIELNK